MVRQPSEASLTGIISTVNRTETPLLANQEWIGDWDDIRNSTIVVISLFTDKPSTIEGLILQWSDNGVDVLTEDKTTVNAITGLGRTGPIATRAQFFRIKYINGSENQTFFRVSVVYKSSGSPLVTIPIKRVLGDDILIQHVRSIIAARKADGTYTNLMSTDDGKLVVVLYGTREDGTIIPLKVTDDGALKVKVVGP